ncbi:prepilin-type N-terminal cleavage/methylation domain-containing protein [Lacipirellula sp.]|uniref:prepilin-type N-terminal cleavage/methylation domain-containing protein n=1 Tax=Lacipirellula sp. TaxID=2691419 RepID=UPI003D0B9926
MRRGIGRGALTLIELLVTMTIMAIIAAAILGTAAAAIESARVRRTQSTIAKIHELIMERYASYETRRIDVDPSITQAIDRWVGEATNPEDYRMRSLARGQMIADARLLGLRELMKMEMPERWGDVRYEPQILSQAPPLTHVYRRYYAQTQQSVVNEGFSELGEMLYMVVMTATGDGEARAQFSKNEIGDVDGDGAREFIDGWGEPIGWLRWPAGVVSDRQPLNPDGTRPGETDHDPFDAFRRDSPSVVWPPLECYPQTGPRHGNFQRTYYLNLRKRMETAASPGKSYQTAYRLTPWIASRHGKFRYFILGIDEEGRTNYPLDPYLAAYGSYQQGCVDPDFPDESKSNITNHQMDY